MDLDVASTGLVSLDGLRGVAGGHSGKALSPDYSRSLGEMRLETPPRMHGGLLCDEMVNVNVNLNVNLNLI